jgi:hypothetical protein
MQQEQEAKAASPVPPASPQPQSQLHEGQPALVSAFATAAAAVGAGNGSPLLVSAFAAAAATGQGSAAVSPLSATPTSTSPRQGAPASAALNISNQAPAAPMLLAAQMAPTLSGELLPQRQQQRGSPPPAVYSAFASVAMSGSPFAATPFAPVPSSAFAAAAMDLPQRSASLSLAQQPSGSMDQASAFAQLAAGLTPFGSGPVQQPHMVAPPASAPGVLPYPGEAAMQQAFSSQLQDAMFYAGGGGEGAGSPPSAAAAAAAVLARNNLAAAAVSNLAARAASLPIQLAGQAGSAADEILNLLPMVGGLAGGNAAAAAALEGLARQHSQVSCGGGGGGGSSGCSTVLLCVCHLLVGLLTYCGRAAAGLHCWHLVREQQHKRSC